MSARIQDLYLHTTKQYHFELLSWSLRNQGKSVPYRLLQSSFIPKQPFISLVNKLLSSQHRTFDLQPKICSNHLKQISLTRSNSTLTSSTPSAIGETKAEMDQCDLLLQKSPKTKSDLLKLKDLLLQSAQKDRVIFDKYRYQICELLLRFRKYDWVDEIESKLHSELTFGDHVTRITKLGLLRQYEVIESLYNDFDKSDLIKIMDKSLQLLVKFGKPRGAILVWITIASMIESSLDTNSSQYHSSLSASLGPLVSCMSDVNDLKFVFTLEESNDIKQSFIYMMGLKYFKLGLRVQTERLWSITPLKLRSSNYLNLMLRLHSIRENEYPLVFKLYKENQHLITSRSKTLLGRVIHLVESHDSMYSGIVLDLIKGDHLYAYQVRHVLMNYLSGKRFDDFDDLATAFKDSKMQPTISILNAFMARASRKSQTGEISQYLSQVYEIDKQPNKESFYILFKHFAKIGDSKSSLSLLELLAQRKNVIEIHHINLTLRACIANQDLEALPKLLELIKELNIQPTLRFIENLMEFHLILGQYSEVKEVFMKIYYRKPSLKMYSLLLKSFLFKKELLSAHIIFHAFKSKPVNRRNQGIYYSTLIEYYSIQGIFSKALQVMETMKKQGIPRTSLHYHILMSSYNRCGRYKESLVVFRLLDEENVETTPFIYRDLLFSLVQTSIIDKTNFKDPIAVVDNLIEESHHGRLGMNDIFPFLIIKPVVSALTKFYNPDDAQRIMGNFKVINPAYNVDEKVNFLKQEMLLYSALGQWGSFEVSYGKFQDKIKSLLNTEGKAPLNLKKVYSSFIKKLFQFYINKNQLKQFSTLFHDLIFVHGFTFTSNNINWVVRRLVMNRATFHSAMYLVEKKLVGGFAAKKALRSERAKLRRIGQKTRGVRTSKGRYLRPKLALGYIYRSVLERQIYNYIMSGGRGNNPQTRNIVIQQLKETYPNVMKHLPSVFKRIKRRDRYFKTLKAVDPKRSARSMAKQLNKRKRMIRKQEIERKRQEYVAKSRAHLT